MSKMKEFTLVIPDDLADMSVSSVKLCELFIFKVLSSPENEIVVSVNEVERDVRSNDVDIKSMILMLLGSSQLRKFYQQLMLIAHKSDEVGLFLLKVLVDGRLKKITIRVKNLLPNLQLQIVKSDDALRD